MKFTNTYIGGLDTDTSHNKYSNKCYYDMQNFRVITSEGLTTGAIENLRSHVKVFEFQSDVSLSFVVCGTLVIRDILIIFTHENVNNKDYIFRIDTSKITNAPTTPISIITAASPPVAGDYYHNAGTKHLVYYGDLGFSTTYPIKAVGRYDNDQVIKIYWIDGVHELRHLNIVHNATQNNLETLSIDKLSVLPNSSLNKPDVTGEVITGGSLMSGMVGYAYQLFNALTGAETTISPISGLIHITSGGELNQTSELYKGTDKLTQCYKGVKGSFTITDTGFSSIRIYRLHYESLNADPEVGIISEQPCGSGKINFYDNGDTLETITLESFRMLSNVFIPKDIEVKDNRLILANITDNYFYDTNIEAWDSRAYRYSGAGGTTTYLVDTEMFITAASNPGGGLTRFTTQSAHNRVVGESIRIGYCSVVGYIGTYTIMATPSSDTFDVTLVYTATCTGIYQVAYAGASPSVPTTSDAINLYNYLDYDDKTVYTDASINCRTQYNIGTLGGTGINISYNFELKTQRLDEGEKMRLEGIAGAGSGVGTLVDGTIRFPAFLGGSIRTIINKTTLAVGVTGGLSTDQHTLTTTINFVAGQTYQIDTINSNYTNLEGSLENPYHYDYSSPVMQANYTGYQRGEVYRFGIVFIDEKGRESFVKWIGDIRMPNSWEQDLSTTTYLNNGVAQHTFDTVFFDNGDSRIYMNILGIKFTVTNVPNNPNTSSPYKWRIVRCKRESSDRYSYAQGPLVGVIHQNTLSGFRFSYYPTTGRAHIYEQEYISSLFSPEISYNKNLACGTEDYIQPLMKISLERRHIPLFGVTTPRNIYKPFSTSSIIIAAGPNNRTRVHEGKTVFPNYFIAPNQEVSTNLGLGSPFVNRVYDQITLGPTVLESPGGTNFAMRTDSIAAIQNMCIVGAADSIICNYLKNNSKTIYSGLFYEDRTNNQYIACGNINSGNTNELVYGGDTFISFFNFLHAIADGDHGALNAQVFTYVIIPVESSINLNMVHGARYVDVMMQYNGSAIREVAGKYIVGGGADDFVQDQDMFQYNSVYSQQNTTKIFLPKPFNFNNVDTFPCTAYYSDIAIPNETIDSWTKILSNNKIDVDARYGEIKAIKVFANKLFFFQEDSAFGYIPFNERALMSDPSGTGDLLLGTGGLFETYVYISDKTGLINWKHLTESKNALYWIDLNNKIIQRLTASGDKMELNKVGKINSWLLANIDKSTYSLALYNEKFDEICFVISNRANTKMLVFNELLSAFTGFYSIVPQKSSVITYEDALISSSNGSSFYRHDDNSATSFGSFYGAAGSPSSVTLVINPHESIVCTFNNLSFITDVTNTSDVDQYNTTLNTATFTNTFQNSNAITLTPNTNIKRRLRTWRYQIPRAGYNLQGVALTRTDARFRDSHLKATLALSTYTNKVVLHDVTTSYMPSSQ